MRKTLLFVLCGIGIAACSPAMAQEKRFRDVPEGHWASEVVSSLAARGIVEGYPDGTYQGRRAVTRYELATGLSRVLPLTQSWVDEWYRERFRVPPPPGPAGRAGKEGEKGPQGPAGPVGPRGPRPAKFDELQREQQLLREDLTRLQRVYSDLGTELPRTEVQQTWEQLQRLQERTERTRRRRGWTRFFR